MIILILEKIQVLAVIHNFNNIYYFNFLINRLIFNF